MVDIKEYRKKLDTSIYVGEREDSNLKGLVFCGGVIALIGGIMTLLNIYTHRGFVTYATAAIALVGFSIMYFAGVKRNRIVCGKIAGAMCIVLFTAFAVDGVNDGFAICWALLVPLAYSYFISVKWGLFLGIYYQLLFIVLFYTPLRAKMAAHYSSTFMDRFPILFFCALLLSSVAMVQYHMMTLGQIGYEKNLNEEVNRQTRTIRESAENLSRLSSESVEALAGAIDAKDPYTKGHSARVAKYSEEIARRAGLPGGEIRELRMEALLHDIGKIGIADDILNKPGRLDSAEYETIKRHTIIGSEILGHIEVLPGAAAVARSHHERYDGNGYPEGLAGEEIPLHARIVAIADAYDAMHTDRIYRKALSDDVIRNEIETGRAHQFDPVFAEVFLQLLDGGSVS